MTGLNPEQDCLVEVAVVITNSELEVLHPGLDVVIKPRADSWERMGDFVRNMHTESGLINEVEAGLDLADAEQRAREALAGASGPFAAADALKSGRAIRAQLDQTRSRITTNENLLGSRISDVNPNAAMEKELLEIKTELKTLNNVTLAPQNTK